MVTYDAADHDHAMIPWLRALLRRVLLAAPRPRVRALAGPAGLASPFFLLPCLCGLVRACDPIVMADACDHLVAALRCSACGTGHFGRASRVARKRSDHMLPVLNCRSIPHPVPRCVTLWSKKGRLCHPGGRVRSVLAPNTLAPSATYPCSPCCPPCDAHGVAAVVVFPPLRYLIAWPSSHTWHAVTITICCC